jgi:hypothetical protein
VPDSLPIACSLSAADLPLRRAAMTALAHDALIEARVAGTRADLRFAAGAGVGGRVRRLVAAERRCCPFLAFAVSDGPDEIRLRIDAPAGADAVLADFVAAFGTIRPGPAASRARTRSG